MLLGIIDAFFFITEVSFIVDMCKKYICRSSVALVEETFLCRPSLLIYRFMVEM